LIKFSTEPYLFYHYQNMMKAYDQWKIGLSKTIMLNFCSYIVEKKFLKMKLKIRILLPFILLGTIFSFNVHAIHGPRIQIIHNSASDSLGNVDLWYSFGGYTNFATKLKSNFSYGDATEYIRFTKIYGSIDIFITPAGSVDTTVLFQTQLTSQVSYYETYSLVLTGEPGNNLSFYLSDGLDSVSAISGSTSVKLFHGSVGTPKLDIEKITTPSSTLVSDLDYGESVDYIDQPAIDCIWRFKTSNGFPLADFLVPFSYLADSALSIHASGYLDTTGSTPNKPFRLLFVSSGGLTGFLDPISISASLNEPSTDFGFSEVYPNPVQGRLNVTINSPQEDDLKLELYDISGKLVRSYSFDQGQALYRNLSIDLNDVQSGMYILQMSDGYMTDTRRVQIIN